LRSVFNTSAIAQSATHSFRAPAVLVTTIPRFLRCLEIDLIDPNAEVGDDFQLRQCIHQSGIDVRVSVVREAANFRCRFLQRRRRDPSPQKV
jgi:hypothetical protein